MLDADHTSLVPLDRRFEELRQIGSHMVPLWQDCARFYLPTRMRSVDSDTGNRGSQGNPFIVDGFGTQALSIARSGLLAGLANPSSTWFEQATVRPVLNDNKDVQIWVRRLRDIELAIFDRSNTYSALSAMWRDELLFGTACGIILPDDETVIRTEVFPPGGFWIDQDERGRVDTIAHEFSMSVRTMCIEFGIENLRPETRSLYRAGQLSASRTVRHLVAPNPTRVAGASGPAGFPWLDIYWEKQGAGNNATAQGETTWGATLGDGSGGGLLRLGGWLEFPGVAPRWDRNDEEIYAVRCPGIDALGDVMELQASRRMYSNGRAKMVNPPIVGGPGIDGKPFSLQAGAKNIDSDMAGGGTGTREVHDQRLPLNELREDMNELRERIANTFMVPFFIKLLTEQRAQPATAEEIRALDRERATMLGPIESRQADELLDPYIGRVTSMLFRMSEPFWANGKDGILPLPPDILIKQPLRVRYVSDVATQQRIVNLGPMERHAQFLASLAPLVPDIMDTSNFDVMASEHAKAAGVPPTVPRTVEEIMQMRADRMRQQQQAQLREQAPGLAKAAKDLSETRTDGNTALDAVAGGPAVRQ